jgi:hypothetical protein
VTNQNEATFTVDGTVLGAGQHPVYAVVTDLAGRKFRTAVRDVSFLRHPPLELTWSGAPFHELSWNGTMGFRYEVLASDALEGPYGVRHTLEATNTGTYRWQDPETSGPAAPRSRFYQVRGLP